VTYRLLRGAQDGTALARYSTLLDTADHQLRQLLSTAQWSDVAIDSLITDLRAKAAGRSNSSASTSSTNNSNTKTNNSISNSNPSHNSSSSSAVVVYSTSAAAAAAAAAGASHSALPRHSGYLDSDESAAGQQSPELPPWRTLQVCTEHITLLTAIAHCYAVSSFSQHSSQRLC
jgi:hypothetical protein